jgi:hypothetical protein
VGYVNVDECGASKRKGPRLEHPSQMRLLFNFCKSFHVLEALGRPFSIRHQRTRKDREAIRGQTHVGGNDHHQWLFAAPSGFPRLFCRHLLFKLVKRGGCPHIHMVARWFTTARTYFHAGKKTTLEAFKTSHLLKFSHGPLKKVPKSKITFALTKNDTLATACR